MAAALRRNPRIPFPRNLFSTLSTQPENAPLPPPSPPPSSISGVKSAIRSESDPDRLAELFQSSTHSRRFHGDKHIYKLSIQKLARSNRPDLIERLLEHQKSDPVAPKSEGFLIRIMTLYSASGMVDRAVQTFDYMAQIGCTRTERSLCALLTVFVDNRLFDRVHEAFDRVPKELGISPGRVPHNILLNALCQEGSLETARSLLDEMPERGVTPDIVSYNTILNGYFKKGDEAGFEGILKEISNKGLDPNVITYNCRIAALCAKKETFKAEELLDVMVSKGIELNLASFNTIIDGFCKEGDVDSALRVFKRMRVLKRVNGSDGVSPNAYSYVMLIPNLVNKGEFDSALEVCQECLTRNFSPPFEAVKGLVDGLVKNSKVNEAKDVVAKMKKAVKGDAVDAWTNFEGSLSLKDEIVIAV